MNIPAWGSINYYRIHVDRDMNIPAWGSINYYRIHVGRDMNIPAWGSINYYRIHVDRAMNIQEVDPSCCSIIWAIGALEPRVGGSTFPILPGVWEWDPRISPREDRVPEVARTKSTQLRNSPCIIGGGDPYHSLRYVPEFAP